jgi:hypothetical protein
MDFAELFSRSVFSFLFFLIGRKKYPYTCKVMFFQVKMKTKMSVRGKMGKIGGKMEKKGVK